PAYSIVTGVEGTDAFVAAHGLPAVLKRGHGFAGQGVAICNTRPELVAALARFTAINRADPLESAANRHLLQTYVAGRIQYFHAVAWKGALRAGWALEKLVANPAP